MKFVFNKAKTSQGRTRMTIIGPSGSGKTYSALRIAEGLGQRIAVIDTENGSASKYAGDFDFHVLVLEEFSPQNYVRAIRAAQEQGFDVIIIDSLSHAWIGKGGALEMVNKAERRYHGNSFAAWRDVTPHHNALIDAMVQCQSHLITTMRSKTDYVIETNDKGRKVPRKIGLAPVQRDGIEYEFDIVADIDLDHNLVINKTRCRALDGAVFKKPGRDLADIIARWLSDGEQTTQAPIEAPAVSVDLALAGDPQETKPPRKTRKSAKKTAKKAVRKTAEVFESSPSNEIWKQAAIKLKQTAVRHFNGDHETVLEALKRKEGVNSSKDLSSSRLTTLNDELELLVSEGEPSMRAQLLIWRQMVAQPSDAAQPSLLI